MGVKFANNGYATLASSVASSDTSLTVTSGQGARFPTLAGGDYFYTTLIDASNNLEIVKCTARTGDVLTVVRGQESTAARSYTAGDRIEQRITAAALGAIYTEAVADATPGTDTITAAMIQANAVGASELNVSGNGSSGQALLSDGDGTFSWGTGGDAFGTENGTYTNSGTFSGSYGANTLRTVSIAAGRYFILFTSSIAVQYPSGDPDGVTVKYREDGSDVVTHAHEEDSVGPVSSRTTVFVRTFSSSTSVTVYVPSGGDGDGGGLHLHTMLKLIKLD